MSLCVECSRARESGFMWRMYDPACLWCGARYLQALGRRQLGESVIRSRRSHVLDVWHAQGHSREELRSLAKATAMPMQPLPAKAGRAAA